VRAIIGRGLDTPQAEGTRGDTKRGPAIIQATGLLSAGIGPVSFELHSGEVLGVYGLTGSGRTELLETLFGARKVFGGRIELKGRQVDFQKPSQAVAHGVVLVPSDRLRKSIWATLGALDNTLMPRLDSIDPSGIRNRAEENKRFLDVATRLELQPLDPQLEARRFSGGNQQKLVIGRWLQKNDNAQLLLLDEPTQGVDVGARTDLYSALRAFASDNDRAVIVTSSEPSELIVLADRVIVLANGRIACTFAGSEMTELNLLSAAQHH
jgi:ribose transport system ATP-binding protein